MLLHLINSHLDLGRKGQGYPKSLNFKCGGSYAEVVIDLTCTCSTCYINEMKVLLQVFFLFVKGVSEKWILSCNFKKVVACAISQTQVEGHETPPCYKR